LTTVHLGVANKLEVAQHTLAKAGLTWSAAAAMGDDWPDLGMMMNAGLAIAPPGAHAEVLACAHHVCQAPAGAGAFREACDLILIASGAYARLLNEAKR
jgi:3-deoxy-D-manno-octulosonate 8-phosphate phosphatase (KDO 8-P phosphatase)